MQLTRGLAQCRAGYVHYLEAGAGGEPMVLIPQAGRTSRMYQDLVKELAGQTRVIAFDLPGTGGSDSAPSDFGIADYAECIVEALDSLNVERFGLFGLHAGNKVATAIAVREPDRTSCLVFAGQSHSIIASNKLRANAFADTASVADVVSAEDAEQGSYALWFQEFRELSSIWWSGELSADPTAQRQSDAVRAVRESLETFLQKPYLYRALAEYDLETELGQLQVPTLIVELVSPMEDREIGRQGSTLLRHIANSQLRTMDVPDAYIITLEDRALELANVITEFMNS